MGTQQCAGERLRSVLINFLADVYKQITSHILEYWNLLQCGSNRQKIGKSPIKSQKSSRAVLFSVNHNSWILTVYAIMQIGLTGKTFNHSALVRWCFAQ